MRVKLSKIARKDRIFILAYDQGMEHGTSDFNDSNVDPAKIIDIANKLNVTGLAVQKGIAERYRSQIKVPLIVKLNGKTNLLKGEPLSEQLCSVKEAMKLKAAAVGYTIYLGSQFEPQMLSEFARIEEEAHAKGIPVILWAYPRGKSIERRDADELMAYSARAALELGADVVKLHYTGHKHALKWAVKAAGKTKVIVAGGSKVPQKQMLNMAKEIMSCGAAGLAIGRNVWQDKEPLSVGMKLKGAILKA